MRTLLRVLAGLSLAVSAAPPPPPAPRPAPATPTAGAPPPPPHAPPPGQARAPAPTAAPAGTTAAAGAEAKETPTPPGKGGLSVPRDDPFPSTYKAPASPPFAIRNATLLTAAGPVIPNGTILVRDGKIVAVGAAVDVPAGTTVIDAGG